MIYASTISEREKEVIRLIAFENTEDEIAAKLYISTNTVKTHKRRILDKLAVRNVAGIVRKSFEMGILSAAVEHVVYV
ncbi:MAG: LuxR C-terminal-related transcriptional regulator [Saprospiraceae bacterium]|nr:LuxR C-terminal-related transcriptional regulator [Saprospiraceae bacterium]